MIKIKIKLKKPIYKNNILSIQIQLIQYNAIW